MCVESQRLHASTISNRLPIFLSQLSVRANGIMSQMTPKSKGFDEYATF